MIKFLHIADLHMDRSFEGVSELHPSFAMELKEANYNVLDTIYEHAYQHQVDFVILAGDNFHQATSSLATQRLFTNFLTRLQNNHIPVYLIFGNHDYYDQKRYWFDFPDNVTVWKTSEVVTHYLTATSGERVALSGFSYTSPWINKDMSIAFPEKQYDEVDYHLGIYHGNRGSLNSSDDKQYAPFSLTALSEKKYDYWALGHIHVPTILDAQQRFIYPGTPQGHNRKEQQVKGVVLATLDKNKSEIDWLPVNYVSYEKKVISLKTCHTLTHATQHLIECSQSIFSERSTELLFLELVLKDCELFSEELEAKIATNELAEMIQQMVSEEKLTISKLSLQKKPLDTEGISLLHLPIDDTQIEAIVQNFMDEGVFNDITSDLTNHKLFSKSIALDEDMRRDVLKKMTTSFYQKIIPGGR